MKRRRVIVTSAVTLALASLLAVIFWPAEKEPEYQGKKLSEWAEIKLTSNTTIQQQEEASKAIRAIGTNALPFLVNWVRYDPSGADSIYEKLPRSIRSTGFAKHIFGINRHRRADSAEGAFHVLGEQALPVLPQLVQMLNKACSPIKAQNVVVSLASMREPALMPMLKILADKRAPSNSRSAVADAIVGMYLSPTDLLPAIPVFAQCVKETNCSAALMCARALGLFQLKPTISVPALAQAAESTDRNLRIMALQSLGQFGTNATASLPTIIKAQRHSDPTTRQTATLAARSIAPEIFLRWPTGAE